MLRASLAVLASVRLAALAALAAFVSGCGSDVDLGGSALGESDAGPAGQCAPCAAGSACASGLCAQFAGDLFCGTACSATAPCASGDACQSVTSTTGSSVQVCIPTSNACTPAAPPASPDGGALDHCGSLNGPNVASPCDACGKYSDDCQPNGCYGGYWCNEPAHDCTPPPTTCD
jgi:hypothetical protein